MTTSDISIPEHFADHLELQAFVDATRCVHYWEGTQGFTKLQREYGDRFIVRPVKTRRGVTHVGLLTPDKTKLETISQNPNELLLNDAVAQFMDIWPMLPPEDQENLNARLQCAIDETKAAAGGSGAGWAADRCAGGVGL